MDDPWIPFFAENGHLEDLTPYFQKAGMTGPDSDFLSKSLAICRNPYDKGPYVCLPYVGNAQMFFFDAAKYKEAGVDSPKTWDDVLKAAKVLTDQGGGRYFGYVFRGGQGNPVVADFMPIFWSYGANLFNADRTKVTIDTPEAKQAMKTFMALKATAPPGVESYQADEVGRALAAGTAASSINWPNWVATFEDPSQSKMVGKITYSLIPSGTKPGSSEIGHWTMGIMAAAKNKQEAFDFMVWATSAGSNQDLRDARQSAGPYVYFHRSRSDLAGEVPTLSDLDEGDPSLDSPTTPSEVAGDRKRAWDRAVQGRRRHRNPG